MFENFQHLLGTDLQLHNVSISRSFFPPFFPCLNSWVALIIDLRHTLSQKLGTVDEKHSIWILMNCGNNFFFCLFSGLHFKERQWEIKETFFAHIQMQLRMHWMHPSLISVTVFFFFFFFFTRLSLFLLLRVWMSLPPESPAVCALPSSVSAFYDCYLHLVERSV